MRPCETFTGARIPTPTPVCDMVAIQRGTERPNDIVIITGHIDSRVTDILNSTSDAPGANDDGSGTAAVLEAARVLSKHKFPGTIVYAALSGEEQGLYGGKVLADYAKAQGWNVIADLNNDIIGSTCGSDGVCDSTHVRVLSEGPRWQGHEELAAQQRSLGGENDAPSRNISRFLDSLADRLRIGLDVRQIWRTDRFGRGGDHIEFFDLGFPAARIVGRGREVRLGAPGRAGRERQALRRHGRPHGLPVSGQGREAEHRRTRRHRQRPAAARADGRGGGEYGYDRELEYRRRAQPNITSCIGDARMRINGAKAGLLPWCELRAGKNTTCVGSKKPPEQGRSNPGGCTSYITLPHVRVDDWVFGVSTVSGDGFESPVASAVPGGAFKPYVGASRK